MRSLPLLVLGLLGTTIVGVACGSSDAKQAQRGDEAGAAGAAGNPSFGVDGAGAAGRLSVGGAGGELSTGVGGTPSGGAGGEPPVIAGGAGGDSGLPPITLESILGDWSGGVISTYACETSVQAVTFDIDGSSISVTGWPYGGNGAGTISQQEGGAFKFDLVYEEVDEYTPFGTVHGQFLVDARAEHATLVIQELGSSGGNLAILQRSADVSATPDLVGDWAGTSVRLDSDFAVTDVLASTATFSEVDEVLAVTGEDDDGAFSGEGGWHDDGTAMWTVRPVTHDGKEYGALFVLSGDQTALTAALLERRSDDIYYNELCDQAIFTDVSIHKFGLWARQP